MSRAPLLLLLPLLWRWALVAAPAPAPTGGPTMASQAAAVGGGATPPEGPNQISDKLAAGQVRAPPADRHQDGRLIVAAPELDAGQSARRPQGELARRPLARAPDLSCRRAGTLVF